MIEELIKNKERLKFEKSEEDANIVWELMIKIS
jgi:hypothetical protein